MTRRWALFEGHVVIHQKAKRFGILDTVDLATLLCPAGPVGKCSDLRDDDGVHVDPGHAPEVLDWLLSQLPRP